MNAGRKWHGRKGWLSSTLLWSISFFLLGILSVDAATYQKSYRGSPGTYPWSITVEPGSHTFEITGVPKGGVWPANPSSRTEFYVNGNYRETVNNYWLSSDPSFDYSQNSGSYEIRAIIYDGSWNVLETHIWNVTVREYGSFRATIEPSAARSAGARWRLTSGPDTGWKSSGTSIHNIPVGTYTLQFSDVSGWNKPSNQSITMIANATRIAEGTYTPQNGTIGVTINPAAARSAGAQWRLTSGPNTSWRNSGTTLTVPAGSYTLEYRSISGWDRPSSETVTILGNASIGRTGNYTERIAYLGVTINPSAARNAGAQWRVTSGPDTNWKNSGTTLTLPAGNYTIAYRNLSGWVTPSNESVSLSAYTSNSRTGTYVEHGHFTGYINPSSVRTSARWKLTRSGYDSGWQSNGATLSVPPGSYTMSFNDVSGWDRPSNRSVTINSSASHSSTGVYEQPIASLQVTINPAAARAAGAQWRLTSGPDTNWKNSGAVINNLPVTSYTIQFRDVSGWVTPPNRSVSLAAYATNIQTADYVEHGHFTGYINPSSVRSSARWKLTRSGYDSGWQSNGATLSVPPNTYTMTFNDVSGWDRPSNRSVTINSSASHSSTGVYEQPIASLNVTLSPAAARTAGAQWRLTSGPDTGWKNSGTTLHNLPATSYTLQFREVSGWQAPASRTITLAPYATNIQEGEYTQQQTTGQVRINLDPSEARTAGAQWRLTSGPDTGWKNSGTTLTVPAGNYTVAYRSINGWTAPSQETITVLIGQTTQRTRTYQAAIANPATLQGTISGRSPNGAALGSIQGAQVTLSGVGSTQTDHSGGYRFDNVAAGTYSLQVSASGYHAQTRNVTLSAGQTRNQHVQLTAQAEASEPTGRNFRSPQGSHFMEGVPGNVQFEIEVDWNGSPGTVRYYVGGQWHNATITPLSGGLARATLTAPVPSRVDETTDLRIEVTNGEGQRTVIRNTGVYFYPQPLILSMWYGGTLPWAGSSEFKMSDSLVLWSNTVPSGVYKKYAKVGYEKSLQFDPRAGSLSGFLKGYGEMAVELKFDGVENMGSGKVELKGANRLTFRGLQPYRHDPSWTVDVNGRVGVGAPAVRVVEGVFPPATAVITPMRAVPVVRDVVDALRLRLFLIAGLQLTGEYAGGQIGDGWLGTTGLGGTGYIGVEGQCALELWGAEAGVWVGGRVQPSFTIHPELAITETVVPVYLRAYASAWLFEYSHEIGTELRFSPSSSSQSMAMTLSSLPVENLQESEPSVAPIGARSRQWGAPGRLPVAPRHAIQTMDTEGAAGTETKVLENVLPIAAPAIHVQDGHTRILLTAFDPDKPWYASTDIAELKAGPGSPWQLSAVTDDLQADFSPRLARVSADETVAVWMSVTGDASNAEGPEDVAPLLDIMVAIYDHGTGVWSEPVQLSSTDSTVSRYPIIVFDAGNYGVLWIENEGDATLGNAIYGDSIVGSAWHNNEWIEPQTFWSEKKGIVDLVNVIDADGELHVVFVVDEDGDSETLTDRELYWLTADEYGDPVAVRLTNDSVQDGLPVLLAPNGAPMSVWSRDGVPYYSYLEDWNPQPLFDEETDEGVVSSLVGLEMPNGAAIAYTVQFESGVDIVAAFYDAELDRWSKPTRLTEDTDLETSIDMVWDEDANALRLVYLKTETLREDVEVEIDGIMQLVEDVPLPGRTDLYVMTYHLGHDMAIKAGSLQANPVNPVPGTEAELAVTVRNQGELSTDVEVAFYDGHPEQGGKLIDTVLIGREDLLPGGDAEVSVTWFVPDEATATRIYAVVDPSLTIDDRDRGNNMASIWVVMPDIAIVSAESHIVSPTEVELVATLENRGVRAPTGAFTVEWRLDSPEGDVVATTTVDPIDPGVSVDVAVTWSSGAATSVDDIRVLHIQVVPTAEHDDFDLSNNEYTMAVPLPWDGTEDPGEDPGTPPVFDGSFTVLDGASMPLALADGGITPHPVSGNLYVVGGYPGSEPYSDRILVYNLAGDSWTEWATRLPYGATILSTGVASEDPTGFYMGPSRGPYASNGWGYQQDLLRFDAAAETVAAAGSYPSRIWDTGVVAARDGRIYLFGGHNGSDQSHIYRYDPVTGSFGPLAVSMPVVTAHLRTYTVTDGRIFLLGARQGFTDGSRRLMVFDPETEVFLHNDSEALPVSGLRISSPWQWGDYLYFIGTSDGVVYRMNIDTYQVEEAETQLFEEPTVYRPMVSIDESTGYVYLVGGYYD